MGVIFHRFNFISNNATSLNSWQEQTKKTTEEILPSFYVDDRLTGANNKYEALHLYDEANDAMSFAGIAFKYWSTNWKSLRDIFDGNKKRIPCGSRSG